MWAPYKDLDPGIMIHLRQAWRPVQTLEEMLGFFQNLRPQNNEFMTHLRLAWRGADAGGDAGLLAKC